MLKIPVLCRGQWLEGLTDEVGFQVNGICYLLQTRIADAFLSLLMFDQAVGASGQLPHAYLPRLRFIHARSVVTSLAQLARALGTLGSMDIGDAPQHDVRKARDELEKQVPWLKGVRDSAEHAEDRVRGLNRRGKPMTLAPVSNPMVDAPAGGVLITESLNERRYGWTVDDGTFQEVEVSGAAIEAARAAVQAAFDALPWSQGEHGTYP